MSLYSIFTYTISPTQVSSTPLCFTLSLTCLSRKTDSSVSCYLTPVSPASFSPFPGLSVVFFCFFFSLFIFSCSFFSIYRYTLFHNFYSNFLVFCFFLFFTPAYPALLSAAYFSFYSYFSFISCFISLYPQLYLPLPLLLQFHLLPFCYSGFICFMFSHSLSTCFFLLTFHRLLFLLLKFHLLQYFYFSPALFAPTSDFTCFSSTQVSHASFLHTQKGKTKVQGVE